LVDVDSRWSISSLVVQVSHTPSVDSQGKDSTLLHGV
jgi:hypothetical protein